MPQMRAVISGASLKARPRMNASKKRGGSKMRSSALFTLLSRMVTVSAPSPSTRARFSTLIVLRAMALGLQAEGLGVGVEGAVETVDVAFARADLGQFLRQRDGVRRLHRSVAAIAAAVEARAERAAAGMGDRPQARRAVGNHHADIAFELALDADAVRRHRRLALGQVRDDHLDQLILVDRAAAQLVVDLDVRRDRRR